MRKILFSLIVLLLSIHSSGAADLSFASLNAIYKAKYNLQLNSSIDSKVFKEQVQIFKEELLFAEAINDTDTKKLIAYISQAHAIKEYDLASMLLSSAVNLSEQNSINQAFFYFIKGEIKLAQRKDVLALENYLKASLIFDQMSDHIGLANSNLKVALVNFNGLNNTIAIRYADQAIVNFMMTKKFSRADSSQLSLLFSLKGIANRRLARYDSALSNIEKSIAISRQLGDSLHVAISNGNKASVFYEKGDLELAEPLLLTDYRESLSNKVFISAYNAGVALGNIYLDQNKLIKLDNIFTAITHLKDSVDFYIPQQSLLNYYKLASAIAVNNGEDSLASTYSSKVLAINKRIDSSSRVNDFDRLQEKYLMEKEITKLELLQKANELQSSHLKLRTTLLIIIAFALIVVLWYVYVLRHKNRKIDKLNELLEVKVSERTTRLMEINKELDNYLYRASHDIRRPIRTLLGLNNVVKFTEDPIELKSLFEKVYDTAINMDEMLFKLQMAYELNNTHEVEPVAVYELIDSSLKDLERLIELKNATVIVTKNEKAEKVMANNALLKIAIDNIVENGLIYHNQQEPEVRITTDEGKYYFYIYIQDNGYGIDDAYHQKIFDSYFKISNKTQGSGLGLFLAQRAVSFLAGEINIESVINEGSKFTIKLPINPK